MKANTATNNNYSLAFTSIGDYMGSLEEYLTIITQYLSSEKAGYRSIGLFLLRRISLMTFTRYSPVLVANLIQKTGVNPGSLVQTLVTALLTKRVPWMFLLTTSFGMPYSLEGFALSFFVNQIIKYDSKGMIPASYLTNNLSLNGLYRILKVMKMSAEVGFFGVQKIATTLGRLIEFNQKFSSYEPTKYEMELIYKVKDTDDYVLVEEIRHKERVDEAGVVVVDE